MTTGINTIKAADNGLTSITTTIESMQATLHQARQDKSFKSQSYTIPTSPRDPGRSGTLRFSGGAVSGTTPASTSPSRVGG